MSLLCLSMHLVSLISLVYRMKDYSYEFILSNYIFFTEKLSPLLLTDIDVQQLLIPFDLMLMVKLSVVVYVCEIVPVLLVLII